MNCSCFHAPEQHGPDGCTAVSLMDGPCECAHVELGLSKRELVRPLRQGADSLQAIFRVHKLGLDRNRPYVGQAHTVNGERGEQTLPPITLRDLADVIVSRLEAAGDKWQQWDTHALAQNVCVALEKEFPDHFQWLVQHRRKL